MNPTPIIADIVAAVAFTSALLTIFFYLPWRIRRSYRQTFIAIARAVEAREPHLLGHAEQTARYVVLMARWRGMSATETRRLEYAALLHGIGKVSVPYGLLNSPACLTSPADRFVLRDYVRVGAAILDAIPILSHAADTVRFHHEYVDGSGYPFGRYGKDIPDRCPDAVHRQRICGDDHAAPVPGRSGPDPCRGGPLPARPSRTAVQRRGWSLCSGEQR